MPASTNFFQRPLSAFPFLNLSSTEKEAMTPGSEGSSAATTAKAKSGAKEQSIAQEREMVQQKLDEIIASECIFCGEVMIKSIHAPFITPEDDANEGSEWAI
uniref:Uncharacterized protein n=1 Tax=Peronospora matthiolae TaxID=2874970 RepID=A0AAV1VIA3_9STRA